MTDIVTAIIAAISPTALPIVVCVLGCVFIYLKIQSQRKVIILYSQKNCQQDKEFNMKARYSIYNDGNDYPQFISIYYNPPSIPPEPIPPEPIPPEPIPVSGGFTYEENGISDMFVDDQGNTLVYKEYKNT